MKARLYARAGILVYWIVNLVDRIVEVRSQPDRKLATYRQSTNYTAVEFIPLSIPGSKEITIPVSELIPNMP